MDALSKLFKQAYTMQQLRNAPKSSKIVENMYLAGFDDTDHLISYLQKSFEDFGKLSKPDQYSTITRGTYNTNPDNFSSQKELRKALVDRIRNTKLTRKVPKEYADIEEFRNVTKKTPRYEIDELVTQFLEKDKILNPQYQDKVDVEFQDLIDAYNSRQFDREVEDSLLELERTAPRNTNTVFDFEPTSEKFKPEDPNIRKMLDEIEYKGQFIREKQTTPDVDVQIDTTDLKLPMSNKDTYASLTTDEYKKVLNSIPESKRYIKEFKERTPEYEKLKQQAEYTINMFGRDFLPNADNPKRLERMLTKKGIPHSIYENRLSQIAEDAIRNAQQHKYYKNLYKKNKNKDQIPFQHLLQILDEE